MISLQFIAIFVIQSILSISFINCQSCITPDNRNGVCISVNNCKSVQTLGGISSKYAEFLRSLSCPWGYGEFPYICCDGELINVDEIALDNNNTDEGVPTEIDGTTNTVPVEQSLIPAKGKCGYEKFGNKIYNGHETGLDEFPWMALLEYRKANSSKTSFSCGGVLINHRYVLTAAHCLVGAVQTEVGKLYNVRLGEHNTTAEIDCVEDECADPVVNVAVEEFVTHPDFNDAARNKENDIGLIRLAEKVKYSKFIKPICLPSTVNLEKTLPDTRLVSVGWGRTLKERKSDVKLKLELPVFDQAKCVEKYAIVKADIKDSQLCAGGIYAEDTCDGDSGGPIMKISNNYWAIEGVVSFGRGCGLEGWPAIYTRVSSFEPWIRSVVRA